MPFVGVIIACNADELNTARVLLARIVMVKIEKRGGRRTHGGGRMRARQDPKTEEVEDIS